MRAHLKGQNFSAFIILHIIFCQNVMSYVFSAENSSVWLGVTVVILLFLGNVLEMFLLV